MSLHHWIVFSLASLAVMNPASAETQGFEGMQSTGTLEILVSLNAAPTPTIKISGLEDVSFEKDAGDAALAAVSRSACVYMSAPGTFKVDVTAAPLTSGDAYNDYKITLSDNSGQNSVDVVVADQTVTKSLANIEASTTAGCGGTNPLQLMFHDEGDLDEAFTAQATVSFLVFPD